MSSRDSVLVELHEPVELSYEDGKGVRITYSAGLQRVPEEMAAWWVENKLATVIESEEPDGLDDFEDILEPVTLFGATEYAES